jgi:hypothetical protein
MAATALNSTTLTTAITTNDSEFVVGATTNIAVGNYLVFAGQGGTEAMKVTAIPVSGRVVVARGVTGTRARAHAATTLIWIGSPEAFKTVRDNQVALVGDSSALPEYCLPGTRARDGAGNEYVMVDLTFSAFTGAAVLLSKDGLWTAKALASGDFGAVGIVVEEGTSNQWVWAMIYGAFASALLTSGSSILTSTGILQPATTASVPAGGLLGRTTSQASSEALARIMGIYPTSAASTATTAATSHTGFKCSVWLNYPFLERAMSS